MALWVLRTERLVDREVLVLQSEELIAVDIRERCPITRDISHQGTTHEKKLSAPTLPPMSALCTSNVEGKERTR